MGASDTGAHVYPAGKGLGDHVDERELRSCLREFVDASFEALRCEAHDSYVRCCGSLQERRIRIHDDQATFALHFASDHMCSTLADEHEPVVIRTRASALLDLVDGVVSLEDALRADRIEVFASVADASRLFDALQIYVRGGIRCPSLPRLLSAFRASIAREEC